MRRPGQGEGGFTLLELLVALSLTALLAALLLDGIRFGERAWERAAVTAGRAGEALAAHALVTAWLAGAVPAVDREGALTFTGDAHRLAFVTPFGADPAIETLTPVVLEVDRVAGTLTALWSWQGQTFRRVLASDAVGLAFSYFDGAGGGWTDSWHGRDALPSLVRLAAAEGSLWRELNVAPRIDLSVDCRLFPAAISCTGSTP